MVNEVKEPKRFMKKWWLEVNLPDGCRWAGWINTVADSKNGLPESIFGTFWAEHLEGETGTRGRFDLGDGEEGNYVITAWMKGPAYIPKNHSSEEAERYFKAERSLPHWQRIHGRIEECLVLSNTYIDEF
jgi:hypothetical protein